MNSIPLRHIRNPRTGFSLFEILVVLCLMAALASTALPAVTSWLERQQLDQAVESFMISLNQAIVDSGQEGVARTVELELNGARFRIQRRSLEHSIAESSWTQLPEGVIFRLPDGDTRSSASGQFLRIEIRTDGRTSGTEFLVCRGRQFRTVELDGVSGLARLIRGS